MLTEDGNVCGSFCVMCDYFFGLGRPLTHVLYLHSLIR